MFKNFSLKLQNWCDKILHINILDFMLVVTIKKMGAKLHKKKKIFFWPEGVELHLCSRRAYLSKVIELNHVLILHFWTEQVGNLSISQLCQQEMIITAVNGQLPGPTIVATEGDTVVVHMVNESPYNMTIHW